jgi:ribonuclease D
MWRIKGWTKLEQRQLLFLRELWRWRDHEARRIDAPPFRILNNQQLLDLAVRAEATSKKNIRDAFPLLVKFKSRRRSSLLAAVKKAQSMPQRLWPERSLRKRVWHDRSDCRVEVEAMQAECARVAAQLGMAPSFVASRATLERIVRHGARTMDEMISKGPLLRWQAELLAPRLLPLLKTFTTHTDADENH